MIVVLNMYDSICCTLASGLNVAIQMLKYDFTFHTITYINILYPFRICKYEKYLTNLTEAIYMSVNPSIKL